MHAEHCLRSSVVEWQAIASETGKVMDDFTIKKAAGFKPDINARNQFLYSGYQPNYKPTFLEARPSTAFLPIFEL